jgi:hypothetical protein
MALLMWMMKLIITTQTLKIHCVKRMSHNLVNELSYKKPSERFIVALFDR